MDCLSLVIRITKKLRGNLMCLLVFVCVLAMWAWLECDVLVGLCELPARSKLAIKSLIGGL